MHVFLALLRVAVVHTHALFVAFRTLNLHHRCSVRNTFPKLLQTISLLHSFTIQRRLADHQYYSTIPSPSILSPSLHQTSHLHRPPTYPKAGESAYPTTNSSPCLKHYITPSQPTSHSKPPKLTNKMKQNRYIPSTAPPPPHPTQAQKHSRHSKTHSHAP
jgi:hypothetical protein